MNKNIFKKRAFPLQCILWVLALCSMIFFFFRYLEPVTIEESQNVSNSQSTPLLHPGDTLTQTFQASRDHLLGMEIAFSYSETLSNATEALVQLFRDDKLVMEQPLILVSNNNHSFLYFHTDEKNCLGETFTISVKNTTKTDAIDSSAPQDMYSFAMLSTDKETFYLPNTSDYQLNDTVHNERILCQFTYFDTYTFYPALCAAFIIFLCAVILSGLIKKWIR